MTATSDRTSSGSPSRLSAAARGGGVLAVAIVVMNVATYGFQIVSAHVLGPDEYGGLTALMGLLLIVAVVALGLQATGARRIAAEPEHVAQIEQAVLRVTYLAAGGLGLLMLALAPVVERVLRLDSIVPALLVAVTAVPLTIMGGQAGVLQGERRWRPLSALYLALGIPRLVVGSSVIAVSATEGAAMTGVMLAAFVPAAVGWWALRHGRPEGTSSAEHEVGPMARETLHGSVALLAFFALSNLDIVIARNVLDDTDAGLYAGGLILTKAVLFLPQFVVVVAFPSLSTVAERRRALFRSLGACLALGVASTLGVLVLSGLALVFVGGSDYEGVQSRLWLFAIVGMLLAMLQLLVYSVLARRGARSGYLVWVAVAALVVASRFVDTLQQLIVTVAVIDATLLVVLLLLAVRSLRTDADVPAEPAGPAAG